MSDLTDEMRLQVEVTQCKQCLGTGYLVANCDECDGWGLGKGSSFEIGWPCPTCIGSGGSHLTTCPTCRGTGHREIH